MHLPEKFITLVAKVWGKQGSVWLTQLPELVARISSQWHLNTVVPFDNLTYHFVARARSTLYSKPVVIKIGIPSLHFIQEMNALQFFDGKGCVKLLAHDAQKGALLLELIEPGTTVRDFFPTHDDKAVEFACQVMKKLHDQSSKDTSGFATMEQWLSLFTTLKVPHELHEPIQKALLFAQELKSTGQQEYLLHGDLHHDNILFDGPASCVAIDPKGVIGQQAYEVGAFMCNPEELVSQPNLEEIFTRRLNQFSKLLNIDRKRLVKAVYVRIILSCCWTIQDNGDWRDDLHFAQLVLSA